MKKFTTICILVFLFGTGATAQKYLNQSPLQNRSAAKTPTFWDVQQAFENYWSTKMPSDTEEDNAADGGYQQFKRWEWFVKQRTYPSGKFPSPEILFSEYQKYKTNFAGRNSIAAQSANWTFLGPHVVPANGGGAGRINCIAFDPSNNNIIWIGAACGGLWKSTDGGATWSSNTDFLPALSISDIVIDPNNPQTMYIATGDKYGIYYQYEVWGHYSAGILKSTDGGVTWNPTGATYTLDNIILIQRLVMDPNNSNILFAATNTGILKSTDAGATWNSIRGGSYYDIEFKPGSSTTLYAGDSTGVILTTNAGVNWNYVPTVTSTGRTSISVTPANPNAVYVWSEGGGLFYSNNSATSFTPRTDPAANISPYGYYDMVIDVSPVNENVVVTGGLNIALSTNGGNSWSVISDWAGWPNPNYSHADNHCLKFIPGSSQTFFSCNDGGIFKTVNQGTSWTDLSNGIDIKQYYRMSSSQQNTYLMYAGAQDNGSDKITGLNTATQVMGADGEGCLVDFSNDNIAFVSSQGGYFSKTTDGGNTWNGVSATGCDWTSPITMDPNDHNIIYMGSGDVLKSTDNGNTWNNISNGAFSGGCVYSIKVCPTNSSCIYVATFGQVYRTINGGTTWTNITATLPVTAAAISDVIVSETNIDQAWVTFSGFAGTQKVFATTNGGASWTNVSGTLPNIPVNCIVYQNGSNDLVYIGTDLGVFYRDGTMGDWLPYNNGLPNVIIDELEVYYPTSKLRAATYGRGIWESDLQVSTLLNLDASASSLLYPPATTCDTAIAPVVNIQNRGLDTIFSVELHYKIDALSWQQYNYNGTLASLATAAITLPSYIFSPGVHTLKAYTANPNSAADQNNYNDTINRTFTILPSGNSGGVSTLNEGFVQTTFPPATPAPWSLQNVSGLWSRSTAAGGYGNSGESAMADFFSISSGQDKIITPYIDFANALPPIKMWFDVAYTTYPGYSDTLMIDLYSDCQPGNPLLYKKGGNALSTAAPTTNIFVPTNTQWRTDTLYLDSLAGRVPKLIRFIAKSGYGNQLYIDNINLTANALGISGATGNLFFSVYPNPASTVLNLQIPVTASVAKCSVLLFDATGKIVKTMDATGRDFLSLNIADLADGIYLVQLRSGNSVMTQRVAVVR